MIGDFFNLLFGAGVPYDAERNEFRVRPEDAARIDMLRDALEQEERWNRPAVMFNETYNND